jgi:hypothetical protein
VEHQFDLDHSEQDVFEQLKFVLVFQNDRGWGILIQAYQVPDNKPLASSGLLLDSRRSPKQISEHIADGATLRPCQTPLDSSTIPMIVKTIIVHAAPGITATACELPSRRLHLGLYLLTTPQAYANAATCTTRLLFSSRQNGLVLHFAWLAVLAGRSPIGGKGRDCWESGMLH